MWSGLGSTGASHSLGSCTANLKERWLYTTSQRQAAVSSMRLSLAARARWISLYYLSNQVVSQRTTS